MTFTSLRAKPLTRCGATREQPRDHRLLVLGRHPPPLRKLFGEGLSRWVLAFAFRRLSGLQPDTEASGNKPDSSRASPAPLAKNDLGKSLQVLFPVDGTVAHWNCTI